MVDYTKISGMSAASAATGTELVEVVQSGGNKKMTVDQINAPAKAYADSLVVGLFDDRGNYDASSNLFPSTGGSGTSGAINKGDVWLISVAGTLGGTAVDIGDSVRALVDTPAQTAANWAIMLGTGETFVSTIAGQGLSVGQQQNARDNVDVYSKSEVDDGLALKPDIASLGTMSTQNASAVAVTGGTIGGTDVETSIVVESGTAITLSATHYGKVVKLTNASAKVVTYPSGLTANKQILLVNTGAGSASLDTSALTTVSLPPVSPLGVTGTSCAIITVSGTEGIVL